MIDMKQFPVKEEDVPGLHCTRVTCAVTWIEQMMITHTAYDQGIEHVRKQVRAKIHYHFYGELIQAFPKLKHHILSSIGIDGDHQKVREELDKFQELFQLPKL